MEIVKSNLIDLIDLIDLNCEVLILRLLFLEVPNFDRILPFLVIHESLQYFRPHSRPRSRPCPALGSAHDLTLSSYILHVSIKFKKKKKTSNTWTVITCRV